MKILLSEAHNWVVASRSKIYADANAGVLSTEKDDGRGGKKVIHIAELQRVYGEIHDPKERPKDSTPDSTGQPIDTDLLIQQYEHRIQELAKQLTRAESREDALNTEKSKLLNLTDRLLPAPREDRPETMLGWIQKLVGR